MWGEVRNFFRRMGGLRSFGYICGFGEGLSRGHGDYMVVGHVLPLLCNGLRGSITDMKEGKHRNGPMKGDGKRGMPRKRQDGEEGRYEPVCTPLAGSPIKENV